MREPSEVTTFLHEHWEPDEDHTLLRGLTALTLAFSNVLGLYDVEVEALIRKTCETVAACPEEAGIDEGVVTALNGLWIYGFTDESVQREAVQ